MPDPELIPEDDVDVLDDESSTPPHPMPHPGRPQTVLADRDPTAPDTCPHCGSFLCCADRQEEKPAAQPVAELSDHDVYCRAAWEVFQAQRRLLDARVSDAPEDQMAPLQECLTALDHARALVEALSLGVLARLRTGPGGK